MACENLSNIKFFWFVMGSFTGMVGGWLSTWYYFYRKKKKSPRVLCTIKTILTAHKKNFVDI